ncbi:hypothetical protein BH09VER1_BH09VER1_26230 [soil metagenome]
MKFLLALSLITATLAATLQAGDYSINISGKTTSPEAIRVGKNWRTDLRSRYKITMRSSKDVTKSDLFFRAYFFDADGKIISTLNEPNPIWTSTKTGTGELGMPDKMVTGQLATAYIAIPPEVEHAKALLVIFGSGDDLSYDIHPNTKKIEDLNFPEKDKVKKLDLIK